MQSPPLRVAVAGAGHLGSIHARIYARMAGVVLVGIADPVAERAARVATETGCAAFSSALDLIGRVDALSVVTPTTEHVAVARPFLERGIATLVEKPLAVDVASARELVELAERSGALLQVGHVERFNAGVRVLRGRCPRPRYIEAHRLSPFPARGTDVDVIADLMIHDLDLVLAFVASPIREVRATGIPVLTQGIDIANARIEFANGVVAQLTASRVSQQRFRRLRLFAEERYEALNLIDPEIETIRARRDAEGHVALEHARSKIEPAPPLDAELAAFVDCVRTATRPEVDGRVGLAAMEAAQRVREALSAGC